MQYKGKLTKRSHLSKPFNCPNHSKPFRCSFGGENLVGIGKFCIIYNVETLYCFEGVSVKCGPDDGGWRMADRKMRMIKCGWKIADDKMRMIKCGWKNADEKLPMTLCR